MIKSGTVYIVGGAQKKGIAADEEFHYESGRIVALDVESGDLTDCVEYRSPPEVTAEGDPSILFKAATVSGDTMHVCTTTEIMAYELPTFRRTGYLTHPWLNDVHHVCPTVEGTLLVANTGLDQVIEFATDGSLLEHWSVNGTDTFERFDREVDYRRVASTKPHNGHPNFVFQLGSERWATVGIHRDAISLDDPARRIPQVSDHSIHDGIVFENELYFTSIDGHVIRFDTDTLQVVDRFDLSDIMQVKTPLGWCRGLDVIDRDHVLVAFSRLRPTKIQSNILWAKWKLGGTGWGMAKTRVACVNLAEGTVLWERETESVNMNAIFSVHLVR